MAATSRFLSRVLIVDDQVSRLPGDPVGWQRKGVQEHYDAQLSYAGPERRQKNTRANLLPRMKAVLDLEPINWPAVFTARLQSQGYEVFRNRGTSVPSEVLGENPPNIVLDVSPLARRYPHVPLEHVDRYRNPRLLDLLAVEMGPALVFEDLVAFGTTLREPLIHYVAVHPPGHDEAAYYRSIWTLHQPPEMLEPEEVSSLMFPYVEHSLLQQRIMSSLILSERSALMSDEVTGLKNRAWLSAKHTEEFKRFKRSGRPYSFALLDLDHFKAINDSCGHQTGDRVLRAFGTLLARSVREVDHVGRWGGEEFAVVVVDADAATAMSLMERLRIETEREAFGIQRPVTVSIGVATATDATETPDELVELADQALYVAKRQRNRVAHDEDRDVAN